MASGAPLAGAKVTVYDVFQNVVGTATVSADGSYLVTLPAASAAPFVLEARRDDVVLVSTWASMPTRLNITSLSSLVAARLAPDGNPLSLKANASAVTSARIQAQLNQVKALIQPLLTAVGDTVDPLTGVFQATGTGHDKVLDSLSVSIHPNGGSSNIEVALRTATSDQPVRTNFVSSDASPPPLPGPVQAAALPPDGTSPLITDLAARLTACYAIPLTERVNSTAATAGPSNVVAPACRTLFVDDDPAVYRSGGSTVGAQGSFSGLYRDGATGVVFDEAQLEFLRGNPENDLVFSYRTTDKLGHVGRDTLVARNVKGVLKLIGNQYLYSALVRPFVQDREFVNQPSSNWFSTGYTVNIADAQLNGNPIFAKAVVTTPLGNTLTFKPDGGRAALSIVKPDGSLFSTDAVRLAARFVDPTVAGTPSQYETSLYFANPAFTDDQIRAFPEQGVWKVEFFHADASKPNVVQLHRTIGRTLTLSETVNRPFVQLTASAKSDLKTGSAANGSIAFATPGRVTLGTTTGEGFWTVPANAIPPTSVTVYGSGPGIPNGNGGFTFIPYDDSASVASAARSVTVSCSRQTNADNHCDATNPALYAKNTNYNFVQLFSTDSRFILMGKGIGLYYLRPR